jgi:hypothetical protein
MLILLKLIQTEIYIIAMRRNLNENTRTGIRVKHLESSKA